VTSLAERALAEACRHGAGELTLERIDRSGSDGALLTFRSGKGRRWMRFEGGRAETVSLQRDALLPISGQLARVAADGPLEVLAYHPGRRLVLRQGTVDGARILKAYRRKRLAAAVRCHATASLAAEGTLFRVPGITERIDSLACFSMRDLGRGTFSLGQASAEWFEALGRALRAFQALVPDVELPLHGPAEELGVLDRAAENAHFLTGALPAGWTEARAWLEREAGELEPRRPVLTHRDLHDGQLIPVPRCAGGVGLLDFDLLCRADPCLDLANLSAHLELRALQALPGVTGERASQWSRALCAGHGTDASDNRFGFHGASTFLRLALVYHLRPPWAQLAPELVQRAERCLEEVHHRVV